MVTVYLYNISKLVSAMQALVKYKPRAQSYTH